MKALVPPRFAIPAMVLAALPPGVTLPGMPSSFASTLRLVDSSMSCMVPFFRPSSFRKSYPTS